MTTLTDRLAALRKVDRMTYCCRYMDDAPGIRADCAAHLKRGKPCEECQHRQVREEVVDLRARNALLCEALREYGELIRLLLQHSTYSGGFVTYAELPNVRGNDSLSSAIARHRDNARAILAACEQKP